ncbi:MAG: hypothetical protein DI611_15320 [Brachybacterium faecium]|nr:MAG: hypothetical protein DI611_15320 [Brachybacterium faecium]
MYVVDDDHLLGSTLADWLRGQAGISDAIWIMSAGGDGSSLSASDSSCAVVVASWQLTSDPRFVQQFHVPVIATRAPADPGSVVEAAKRGLGGVVLVDDPPERALAVIKSAAKRGFLCSPESTFLLARQLAELSQLAQGGSEQRLTARESQILDLVACGLTNRAIADTLFIEVQTVKNHIHRIQRKVCATNRLEAVRMAQELTPWRPGV